MQYRPEIDGMRAIAVVAVILFHASAPFFNSGFIGVDLFFVISGYLITTIIVEQKQRGQFSLCAFYQRRVRRIVPALFFVLLSCVPVAWWLMMPTDLVQFAKTLFSAVFFVSNIHLMRGVDYFNPISEENPLLHTWSLGVEGQYYLFFPLFVLMIWRWGIRGLITITGVFALFSFGMSAYLEYHFPQINFYFTGTRAWQFLAGSLCGIYMLKKECCPHNALSALGLGIIIVSILFYDQVIVFPFLYALLPVVGMCLVLIYGDQTTSVGRVLSSKILVGIGVISYSLYLWHYPLFVFARLRSLEPLSGIDYLLLSAVAVVLSYLTWRFIEAPFRQRKELLTTKTVYQVVAGLLLVFIGIGGVLIKMDGLPTRFNDDIQNILKVETGDSSSCHNRFKNTPETIQKGETCLIGDEEAVPHIAVIGDSHASRLTDALNEELLSKNQAAVTYNASWCVPLIGLTTQRREKRHCFNFIEASFEAALINPEIETIILAGQWANITQGYRWGEDQKTAYGFFDQPNNDVALNAMSFAQAFDYTIRRVRAVGKSLIVIGPIPEFETHVPHTLIKVKRFGESEKQSHLQAPKLFITKEQYQTRNAGVLENMRRLNGVDGVTYLDPFPLYCVDDFCRYADNNDGTPLYEDGSHLTKQGALILTKNLRYH